MSRYFYRNVREASLVLSNHNVTMYMGATLLCAQIQGKWAIVEIKNPIMTTCNFKIALTGFTPPECMSYLSALPVDSSGWHVVYSKN